SPLLRPVLPTLLLASRYCTPAVTPSKPLHSTPAPKSSWRELAPEFSSNITETLPVRPNMLGVVYWIWLESTPPWNAVVKPGAGKFERAPWARASDDRDDWPWSKPEVP